MNEVISKMISELLEIHSSGKASVFIYFHGHVNKISVDIYIPKWETGKDADFTAEAYLGETRSFQKFEDEVSRFIKLFNLLNQK